MVSVASPAYAEFELPESVGRGEWIARIVAVIKGREWGSREFVFELSEDRV